MHPGWKRSERFSSFQTRPGGKLRLHTARPTAPHPARCYSFDFNSLPTANFTDFEAMIFIG